MTLQGYLDRHEDDVEALVECPRCGELVLSDELTEHGCVNCED